MKALTVEELIERLRACDPKALAFTVNCDGEAIEVDGVTEGFAYRLRSRPGNEYMFDSQPLDDIKPWLHIGESVCIGSW